MSIILAANTQLVYIHQAYDRCTSIFRGDVNITRNKLENKGNEITFSGNNLVFV